MFQNPIIQTLMLLVGAYSALTFLHKFSPADTIVTVLAGVFAAVLWMLRFNRPQLYTMYQNPVLGPVIDTVCKIAKEQPPVDASVDEESAGKAVGAADVEERTGKEPVEETNRLLLRTPADFAAGARALKEVVVGHEDIVDALMDQLSQNAQLRQTSSRGASLPPLGLFLLVGKPGLGKRRLAGEIGRMLYKSGATLSLDASEEGVGAEMLAGVKSNPYSVIILENFSAAKPQFQTDLRAMVAGVPLTDAATGAKVSFRHCVVFLVLHREAGSLPRPERRAGAGTGQTVVVGALKSSLNLDDQLAWALHGVYPFVLPSKIDQARVVALLMDEECRKHNLRLGRIDPAILAREVEVTESQGGFQVTPSRVAKILGQPIISAVNAGDEYIELGGSATRQQQPAYNRVRH